MSEPLYEMNVDLNVLHHLGINLYSNVPSVLSEVVANAWDADAENVFININKAEKTITIEDDGHGMSQRDINQKYLTVGYARRQKGAALTPKYSRPVMGRKGIGKLSLFSIANEIEVYSYKGGESNALLLKTEDTESAIKVGRPYRPPPIETHPGRIRHGTKFVLRNLKKGINRATHHLRVRIARRFSVIGESHNFQVHIDGVPVSVKDRNYFHKLQNVWHFETPFPYQAQAKNAENFFKRNGKIEGTPYSVRGWIGTVERAGDLSDDGENLNTIVVLMRGKVAQEDVLTSFGEQGIYASYLIGEIEADFLDMDNEPDMATSSRQSLQEEDDRFAILSKFVQNELKNIQKKWTSLREDTAKKDALAIPAIDEWYKNLPSSLKKGAGRLFGKVYKARIDSDEDRRRMLKYSVLAFESMRFRDKVDQLETLKADDIELVAKVFSDLDEIEATLYHQIIHERLHAIKFIKKAVDDNEKEQVLQDGIFKYLWLLDPSWERVEGSQRVEETVKKEFALIDAKLTDKERNGRVDIRYRTAAGKNIIIELKRAGRKVSVYEVMQQVEKYITALRKCLRAVSSEHEPIEAVVVVGTEPTGWSDSETRERYRQMLEKMDTRIVMYDDLIDNAYKGYEQYLEKSKEAGRITKLIESLDLPNPS